MWLCPQFKQTDNTATYQSYMHEIARIAKLS